MFNGERKCNDCNHSCESCHRYSSKVKVHSMYDSDSDSDSDASDPTRLEDCSDCGKTHYAYEMNTCSSCSELYCKEHAPKCRHSDSSFYIERRCFDCGEECDDCHISHPNYSPPEESEPKSESVAGADADACKDGMDNSTCQGCFVVHPREDRRMKCSVCTFNFCDIKARHCPPEHDGGDRIICCDCAAENCEACAMYWEESNS